MSLRPCPIGPVPEETARIAHAAFPHGSAWMRLRDVLGPIYDDASFAALFSQRGRPAGAPRRLALVSVMQFAERLSDRKAVDAVRGSIDWKYALGLPLDDAGFDASVRCEFRARLLARSAEQQLLDALLTLCRDRGWLHARGRQRTDSTHVLAAIRAHNRVEAVRETVRHTLNALAEQTPEWLLQHVQPEWAERYRSGWDDTRLPGKQAERDLLWEYRFAYRELAGLLRRDEILRERWLEVRRRGYIGFRYLIAAFVTAGVIAIRRMTRSSIAWSTFRLANYRHDCSGAGARTSSGKPPHVDDTAHRRGRVDSRRSRC